MKKILALVALVLAGGTIFISPLFVKVKLQCQSQFGQCPEEVSSALSKLNFKSLYKARSESKKILKNNKQITDFSEQYKLPNILLINILVRKPAFAIFNKNSSELWLLDSDGTVLIKTGNTTLPKVITIQSLPPSGQQVDGSFLNALKIVSGVWNMYQVGTGEVGVEGLTVDLPGPINVIFPLDKDPQVLLGALRLIYTKILGVEMSGKYKQIDLRFKNPVLR